MKFNYVVAEVSACKGKMTGLASWIGLALSALVVGTAFGDDLRPAPQVPAGERYAYVRTFRVDGREVRLDECETELDLAKIYPDDILTGEDPDRGELIDATYGRRTRAVLIISASVLPFFALIRPLVMKSSINSTRVFGRPA